MNADRRRYLPNPPPVLVERRKTCEWCGKLCPSGYVTCGGSNCQQAAYNATQERVKRIGRRK